jgi:ABC-type thiamine transport system ATPase subunit
VDKLSGGQQQKIQLGVTIMNDPQLLILDEPTNGFDPVNRRLLMDIIEGQKRAAATLIVVTAPLLCDVLSEPRESLPLVAESVLAERRPATESPKGARWASECCLGPCRGYQGIGVATATPTPTVR